jgi:hypothetical protein
MSPSVSRKILSVAYVSSSLQMVDSHIQVLNIPPQESTTSPSRSYLQDYEFYKDNKKSP